MALLSLAPPNSSLLFSDRRQHPLRRPFLNARAPPAFVRRLPSISASKLPTPPPYPPAPGAVIYQPFLPPPSPLPSQFSKLDPAERLAILRDRLGLWHEYASLIPALTADGFTSPSIEECAGITGIEQNKLVTAAQVRDSLLSAPVDAFDPDFLSFFDSAGGPDLLYELRFLNAAQRAAAASRVVNLSLDPKVAMELARAMKDFPRRRGDDGWDRFSAASSGDCLAFTYFRQSKEALATAEKVAALEQALEAVETESARVRIREEINRVTRGDDSKEDDEVEKTRVTVPVVRLQYGEVAEATTVALLPVCRAAEGPEGIAEAPAWCRAEGGFGVVAAEKGWGRWVVLPGWAPVAEAAAEGTGVAVEFVDGRVLPWRDSLRWEVEEAVLVVADRRWKEVVEEDGLYMVARNGEKAELRVERGRRLLEEGAKEALAKVVLVVRPPREGDDQLNDEDWE